MKKSRHPLALWLFALCFAIPFLWLVTAPSAFAIGLKQPSQWSFSLLDKGIFAPDTKWFAQWPILHEGRVKPMDSFARAMLLSFSGRERFAVDTETSITATEWMANMSFRPWVADRFEVFYIPNPEVVTALGISAAYKKRWAFHELIDPIQRSMPMILTLVDRDQNGQNLSAAQKGILDLYYKTLIYLEITHSLSLFTPDFVVSNPDNAAAIGVKAGKAFSYRTMLAHRQAYLDKVRPVIERGDITLADLPEAEIELLMLGDLLRRKDKEKETALLRIIPLQSSAPEDKGAWIAPWRVQEEGAGTPENVTLFDELEKMVLWAQRGNEGQLGNWVNDSEDYLFSVYLLQNNMVTSEAARYRDDTALSRLIKLEIFYNKADLYHWSLAGYLLAFLLGLWGLVGRFASMRRHAYAFLFAGAALHICGIVLRMVIMGRPPVATLYESILFVGLVSVLFALCLEARLKNGHSLVLGAFLGSALHFLGFKFAMDGDTMGMLVAVLNSNFWLSTHVVTITIGYGTSLVCGAVAHLAGFTMAFGRAFGGARDGMEGAARDDDRLENLQRVLTASVLIALFFTMFGTILGGIWADQSWGRFWGWDPKENGALLIVLWLVFLIHGRLSGFLDRRAYILCGMVTCPIVIVAWFGVNLLSVGLHTYGFNNSLAGLLGGYMALQALVMAVLAALIYGRKGRLS